jgi:hypothetical protein
MRKMDKFKTIFPTQESKVYDQFGLNGASGVRTISMIFYQI